MVYFKDIYSDGYDSTQDLGFYYNYEEFLEVTSGEWVVDLGYVEDTIKDTSVVPVLYDGTKYYVDLNQLLQNGLVDSIIGLR